MEKKFNFKLLAEQIAVCVALLLVAPISVSVFTRNLEDAFVLLKILAPFLIPCNILYFLNFYLYLPFLFFKKKKVWFYVANVASILLINTKFIYQIFTVTMPAEAGNWAWIGVAIVVFSSLISYTVTIYVASGVLNGRRTKLLKEKLAEENQRHTEAELNWLKNQINPHFLFNTLNNISSLTAIDPDMAQDSIGRLSDLLRYAMYESDKPTVALGKEVEFMQNYISLMNLRCGDKTEVTADFDIESPQMQIAPLLLISFIENAYKHGISTNRKSFIHIKMSEKEGLLTFTCANSNFPKDHTDHSGNGIGLQNMRRRMELLYPGRYKWEQTLEDETWKVRCEIKL